MRTTCTFCLVLSLAALCQAAPPEVVPVPPTTDAVKWNEVKAVSGKLLVLSAVPASKWLLVDDDIADVREFDGGKSCAFVAPVACRVRVIVIAPDGTSTRLVIVVSDPPPPPKPVPVDVLKSKLKAAYDADTLPTAARSETAKDLAALYRQAALLAAKPEVATAGDLSSRIKAAASSLVGADALKGVRGIVATELGTLFPADGPLSDDQRKKAADLFTRLAVILDGLGG